jgi:hypothetical protein
MPKKYQPQDTVIVVLSSNSIGMRTCWYESLTTSSVEGLDRYGCSFTFPEQHHSEDNHSKAEQTSQTGECQDGWLHRHLLGPSGSEGRGPPVRNPGTTKIMKIGNSGATDMISVLGYSFLKMLMTR